MADNRAEIVIAATDRTAAAFASARKNVASLTTSVAGLSGAFGPLGAAAATVSTLLGAVSLKGVLDTADTLGKLSQRSGIAVENLSALRYAGELADVSIEELGDSLKKLNVNIAAAARGSKEQAAAFKAIGVEVKNVDGTVRSADDVLGDIADRFSGYADGANKVALANALGGKSFEKLIPLLNGGRQGLEDARKELAGFGGVIGGDLAKKAEAFNDNITRLGFAFEALKVKLAGGLIDDLGRLAQKFVDAASKGDLLSTTLKEIVTFSPALALKNMLAGPGEGELAGLQKRAASLREAIKLEEQLLAANKNTSDSVKRGLEAELAAVNAAIKARAGAAVPAGIGLDELRAGEKDRTKVDAPALPDPAAAERAAAAALAAARKQSEARVKAIQDGLANERDLVRFNEQYLQGSYAAGLTSLRDLYAQREALRAQDLAAQRKAVDAEIAEYERQRAAAVRGGRPQDVAELDGKIADARRRGADAEREAAQAAKLALQQQEREVEALTDQYADLQAQIAALGGDQGPARLLEITRQVRDARKILTQSGGEPADAQRLEQRLLQEKALAESRERYFRLTETAANAEERLLLEAQASGRGLLETEQAVRAEREKTLKQLDAIIAETARLAQAGVAGAAQQLDDLVTQRKRAEAILDPTKLRLDSAADNAAGVLTDGLRQAALEGGKLRDVISDIDKRLASIALDVALQPLEEDFKSFLKGAGGKGLGQNIFSFFGFGGPQTQAQQPEADSGGGVLGGLSSVFGGLFGGKTDVLSTTAGFGGGNMAQMAGSLLGGGATNGAAAGAAAGLTSVATTAQLAATALGSLAGSVGGKSITDGLGKAVTSGGASSSSGGFLDSAISFFTSFFHGGGIAGQGGTRQRSFPAAAIATAERYHRGGIAGLAADEVPAILRRGEEVITEADPRHRGNGGRRHGNRGPVVNLTYVPAPSESRATTTQRGRELARMAQQGLRNG